MVTANESKSDSSVIGQQLSILLPEGTHGLMMLRMIATTVMMVMVVGWCDGNEQPQLQYDPPGYANPVREVWQWLREVRQC